MNAVAGPIAGADSPLIFLMAGEPSGDALGARLMAALRRETNGRVRFAGIGGERMAAEGLDSLFPMAELSIMGVAEVIPSIPRVYRRIRQTTRRIRRLRPSAVVSIDATGFCFAVEHRLKGAGIPLIHYVAPMVWAWRPWRARGLAHFLDHMMTLLPFEPPYFDRHGLATSFVGHPVLEEGADRGDGPGFRARHGLPADAPVIAVLPGSRRGETSRLLPVFAATLHRLKARYPTLHAVVATVATVAEPVEQAAKTWPVPTVVVRGQSAKYDAFAAANVALAASGTVSLELALARVPTVIAYRISPVTAWFGKRIMARLKYASIINLMLDRAAIPEYLQDQCRPELLAAAIGRLLDDAEARRDQIDAAARVLRQLGQDGPPPSVRAARTVLAVIASRARRAPAAG